jgi:TatD DNase family protein
MAVALVDFHCHLDLYRDHEAVIAECERDEVYTLAVTTTPKAWARNRELAAGARHVRVALGLHPQLVAERAGELSLWENYLDGARYIGEVGLDAGPRFFRSLDLQRQVFTRVLEQCAARGGKILTVHSVRAVKAVLDLIEAHLPPDRGRVVLHWFTGSKAEARRAVDLGCYFSLNAEMLRGDRHQDLVAGLPLERLLTETDGPFTKVEGRVARPRDVGWTVGALAQARRADPDVIAAAIAANLRILVSGDAQ